MKVNKFLIIIFLIFFAGMICLSAFSVKENEFVIVTQFGKPVRIIEKAGLCFKLPGFLQTVNRFDKRTEIFKTQPIQLLLGDKNPLVLTCYICWRIHDPLMFFQSLITKDIAAQKLSDMVNSQVGSTLGDYTIHNIINTDAAQVKLQEIESTILSQSNEKAKNKYGIEIVSIGIRRINYPSIVAESVYDRMRAEREKEAKKYRAEGKEEAAKIMAATDKEVKRIHSEAYKKAEIIKGKGDNISMKVYADAYGKDPKFFEFIKSLETLKEILKNKSTLILSTKSDVFKYLNYQEQKEDK